MGWKRRFFIAGDYGRVYSAGVRLDREENILLLPSGTVTFLSLLSMTIAATLATAVACCGNETNTPIDLRSAMERGRDLRPIVSDITGPDSPGTRVVFSRNSKYLVGASESGQIRVWDTADWSYRVLAQHRQPISEVAISAEGRSVYVHGQRSPWAFENQDLSGYSLANGRLEVVLATGFEKATFAEDGRILVTQKGHPRKTVGQCDVATPRIAVRDRSDSFQRRSAGGLMLNADFGHWSIEDAERPGIARFREKQSLIDAVFSPDERWLITLQYHAVPGDKRGMPRPPRDRPATRDPFAAVIQHVTGRVQLRDVKQPMRVFASLDCPEYPRQLALSPDGKRLIVVAAWDPTDVWVCSVPELKVIHRINADFPMRYHQASHPVAFFSCDGAWLFLFDGVNAVIVYATDTFREAARLRYPSTDFFRERRETVLSPDGRWLVIDTGRPAPAVFRVGTWERILLLPRHTDTITSVRFASDGRTVRTLDGQGGQKSRHGTGDGVVCIWDAATLKLKSRLVAPNGYGMVALCGAGGQFAVCRRLLETERYAPVKILDVDSGHEVGELKVPHYGYVSYFMASEKEVCCYYEEPTDDSPQGEIPPGIVIGRPYATYLARFELPGGRRIARHEIRFPERDRFRSGGTDVRLAEDGKHLWILDGLSGDPRGLPHLGLYVLAIDGGNVTRHEKISRDYWGNYSFDLVPGGRWFSIGSLIFDRQTVHIAGGVRADDSDCGPVFSADGSRYAALHLQQEPKNKVPAEQAAEPRMLACLRETLNGRAQLALPIDEHGHHVQFTFSPDGRRLAAVGPSARIYVWELP